MTHSYTIAGITCNGCVAKVKNNLLRQPDVTAAEVMLEGQKAVISMTRHLTLNELQEAIGKDTKYRISHDNSGTVSETPTRLDGFRLATYKPLLIVVVFVSGIAVLKAGGNYLTAMNNFMAGFFLVFSFFKLLDLKGFASSYAMYDVIAKRIPVFGYFYPFIELALGLAYLTGFNPVVTNWTTLMVMSIGSVGVIQSVMNKEKIRCACLGAVFNLPMSTVTIIEDLVMAAMAGIMLV